MKSERCRSSLFIPFHVRQHRGVKLSWKGFPTRYVLFCRARFWVRWIFALPCPPKPRSDFGLMMGFTLSTLFRIATVEKLMPSECSSASLCICWHCCWFSLWPMISRNVIFHVLMDQWSKVACGWRDFLKDIHFNKFDSIAILMLPTWNGGNFAEFTGNCYTGLSCVHIDHFLDGHASIQ